MDGSGNVYVTGESFATWTGPGGEAPLHAHSGGEDIVVLKLAGDTDTAPDPFTFTDVTGVPLSTVQTSNAITVSGIAAPAPISIDGGEYELGSTPGVWTASDGTVNNGDTVRVRHTSAATYNTASATTLTIGGISDIFTSTTQATPPPIRTSPGLWTR